MSRCCQFSPELPNLACGPDVCTANMAEVHHHHVNSWRPENGPVTMRGAAPHDCGFMEGSFACKIRHIHLDTSWAKKDH